jgi:ornithine carbamoyltransferase
VKRDFVSIGDFTAAEIDELFQLSRQLKEQVKKGELHHPLKGKVLAMIFEKPSLRTRVTFETGMVQLGGHAIYLGPQDIQLGKRESVPDVARNLSRWVNCIMARTFSHQTVIDLAKYATVPVINALSDSEHPCQILADFLTMLEHKGSLKNLLVSYVGDSNNVCNSMILFAAIYGMRINIASPKGYEPTQDILDRANKIKRDGFEIAVLNNPKDSVKDADVIYTDVWASMGQESEREERMKVFKDFQVNSNLISGAKKDVIILHCLPAHRGEEITDEIIDGPHSVVLDEAENRLHTEKALLVKLLTSS